MMDEISPGQRSISADALNDAISGGRTSLGTRVTGGATKQIAGVGQVIDSTQRQVRDDPDAHLHRDVVIKKSPSLNAGWVTVQRVQEKDWPIQPCTDSGCRIQVFGDEFEARPYYGKKTDDYKDYEVAVDSLGLSDTFFKCHWDGRLWRLDAPPAAGGGETDICLVHGAMVGGVWSATGDFVRIIHVKKNPDYVAGGTGQPTHIWAGLSADSLGYSIVQCWPGTKEADWQYFLSTNQGFPPAPLTNAVYLTTKMIGGVEYICPEVFAESGTPDTGTLAGDC